MGQPAGWVGLGWVEIFKIFGWFNWIGSWVRNGRSPKFTKYIFTEFIDTDGHGVSRQKAGAPAGGRTDARASSKFAELSQFWPMICCL